MVLVWYWAVVGSRRARRVIHRLWAALLRGCSVAWRSRDRSVVQRASLRLRVGWGGNGGVGGHVGAEGVYSCARSHDRSGRFRGWGSGEEGVGGWASPDPVSSGGSSTRACTCTFACAGPFGVLVG